MNYKKVLSAGVSGLMMLSVILPSFALAEENQAAGSLPRKEAGFCERLPNFEKEVSKRLEGLGEKRFDKNEDRIAKMKDRWANFDAKRDERRAQEEANKTEKYAKIGDRLKTDAQKAALETFKAAVNSAVQARKAAVDLAVKTYRDGIEKALSDKKASLEGVTAAYKTAILEALAKAKTDCAGGIDPKTVKENFMASQKAAQVKMKADREAAGGIADAAKSLMDTRKQAVEKAHNDFKASLEKAKADLKTALAIQ